MSDKSCLEVCCDSLQSVLTAQRAGADRIELCSCLMVGGLTPDAALYEMLREKTAIPLRCLIRPRFGDFLYSEDEVELMARQIKRLRALGADGFVIGCLNEKGELNIPAMKRLIEASQGAKLTLHRCIDVSADGLKTAAEAAELGIDTILTSGQKENCWQGRDFIGKLLAEKLPLTVMPGAGVNADIIKKLRQCYDLNVFHMSGKEIVESKMEFRREGVPMGLPGFDEFSIYSTSFEAVKAAKAALYE